MMPKDKQPSTGKIPDHELLSSAIEQSPTPIIITDTSGNIEYVNPAFTKITEYTLDEIRGKTPSVLKSGRISDEVYQELWQTILAGKVWYGELTNRKKSGELYTESIYIAPIKDPKGDTIHFVGMWQDITRKKEFEEKLQKLSVTDPLCGVYNRRGFNEISKKVIDIALRQKKDILILIADVNRMKDINDKFGHQAGDEVLKETAGILGKTFRDSDVVARIGGDEFAVCALVEGDSAEGAIRARIEANLKKANSDSRRKYQISLSCGAVYKDPAKLSKLDAAINEADKKLYQDKKRHRNSRV